MAVRRRARSSAAQPASAWKPTMTNTGAPMRQRMMLALLLATTLVLAACGGGGNSSSSSSSSAAGKPVKGGSLTVLEDTAFAGSWPTGLDPATNTTGGANISMQQAIYGGLFLL